MSGCPLEVGIIFMFLRVLRNTRRGLVKIMKHSLTIRIPSLFGIYFDSRPLPRCIKCRLSLVFIVYFCYLS